MLPDKRGYFGEYGGRFVPETLAPALSELEKAFAASPSFNKLDDSSINVENVVNAPQNPAIHSTFISGPRTNLSSLSAERKPITKHPSKLTINVPYGKPVPTAS